MPSIVDMCTQTRLLCDEPLPQRPSSRRVLQAVVQNTQHLYNRLENTGEAWSLKPDYPLNVANNTNDYLLAIDESYGKPIQVLSTYPTNPSYIQRYIPFREFASMNFDWPYPQNLASWIWTDGSNCTAMRMAFYYRDDGSRWVRVLPQPQLSATYIITFASGDWVSTAGIDQSPVLSQFHPLVETWAAESILASSAWWGDENMNINHRKELGVSLKNDEMRFSDEFDIYVRNLVVDQMGTRDSSLDGDSFMGWS
jgi:hypothetical protein